MGVGVYFDQDMLVPGANDDRDYTMGLGVEVFQDRGPLYLMGGIFKRLDPLLGFDRRCGRVYRSFLLGSVTYTPDDIGDPEPIYDDRPYSSLIYLANKQVVADDDRALGVELMVGALGLNIANQVQSSLHQWYRDVTGSTEPVESRGLAIPDLRWRRAHGASACDRFPSFRRWQQLGSGALLGP